MQDTISIGPVDVVDSATQYRLVLEPLETVEIGSPVEFNLTLSNIGSETISATVDINKTDVFTPIDMTRVYFDSVPAGGSASQIVTIGVASSTSSGYYFLPLSLTTSKGQTADFDAGISVSATPEVTISLDSSSGSTDVEIANTGNSQIRSVYATAGYVGSSTKASSFVGTLNVDDFADLSLTSSSTGVMGSTQQVNVYITFKDSNNIEHTLNKTLDMDNSIASQAYNMTTGKAGTTNAPSGGMGPGGGPGGSSNPLGFLMGGSSGSSSSSSASSTLMIIGGVAVVALAGYLFYRFYWKNRKAKGAAVMAETKAKGPAATSEKGKAR